MDDVPCAKDGVCSQRCMQLDASKYNEETHPTLGLQEALQKVKRENRDLMENYFSENIQTLGLNEAIYSRSLPKVLSSISVLDAEPVESMRHISLSKETFYKITKYGINRLSSSEHSDIRVAVNSWQGSQLPCQAEEQAAKDDVPYPPILQNARLIKKILKNVKPPMPNWRNYSNAPQLPRNVNEIPRLPIHCPHCDANISPSALMSHMITHHINNYEIFFIELYLYHRCVVEFEPKKFQFDKVSVLDLFAYGGSKRESVDKPIRSGIALPNVTLPLHFAKYQDYTPVVLLMCRTSWAAVFGSIRLYDDFNNQRSDDTSDIWVIWLASTQMVKPLHATISVYNHILSESLSRIVCVRNLADSQKCCVFMRHDFNFLDLSYGHMKSLSYDFSKPISMEVIFNAY